MQYYSFQNFGVSLHDVFLALGYGVLSFIVPFIGAVLIFAIGWVLAVLLERLVESIIKALKIDALLRSAGMEDVVKRAGYTLNTGHFIGVLVKWFVIVIAFILALDTVGLPDVNYFLGSIVVSYIPNVIIAVLILVVAVIVADALQKIVIASVKAAHLKSAHLLGTITKWSIWIVALIAAMEHLGVPSTLLEEIVTGVVFAVALAVGLAFGLGAKDAAGRITDRVLHHVTERE